MKLGRTLFLITLLTGTSGAVASVNVLINLDGSTYADVFVNGSPATKYNIVFISEYRTCPAARQSASMACPRAWMSTPSKAAGFASS